MKHPDDVAKEMAALAARHGYGLVSATLSGRSIVGSDVPRYVYGERFPQSQEGLRLAEFVREAFGDTNDRG